MRTPFRKDGREGGGFTRDATRNFVKDHFIIIILLGLALFIGLYTRLSYSFSHTALPSIDPYGHLLVTKHLLRNELYPQLGFYDDYPRGFHAVVSAISLFSGLDPYTTFRFLGGIFGIISIGSMFLLISKISNRLSGGFAAFLYSGILITREMELLVTRQIQPIPEVMGYAIMPIVLYFVYEFFKGESSFDRKYAGLLLVSTTGLFLIHPYTALMCLYMIILLTVIFAIQHKNIRILGVLGVLLVIPILITFTPVVQNFFQYGGSWGELINDLLSPKLYLWPSTIVILLISLAVLGIMYGMVRGRVEFVFIGTACVLFGFMNATGMGTISKFPQSRAAPFLAVTIIWVLSLVLSELIIKVKELLGWLKTRYPSQLRFKKIEKHTAYIQGAVAILIITELLQKRILGNC